jgi:hypothetical protein
MRHCIPIVVSIKPRFQNPFSTWKLDKINGVSAPAVGVGPYAALTEHVALSR